MFPDPLPRKVGGVCDPTRDDPCDDHYAVCISGSNSGRSEARCECADGFAPEEDLTCSESVLIAFTSRSSLHSTRLTALACESA